MGNQMDNHARARRDECQSARSADQTAVRAAFRRAVDALRDVADACDAAGMRPLGTTLLHEAREVEALQLTAAQRLEARNDNGRR